MEAGSVAYLPGLRRIGLLWVPLDCVVGAGVETHSVGAPGQPFEAVAAVGAGRAGGGRRDEVVAQEYVDGYVRPGAARVSDDAGQRARCVLENGDHVVGPVTAIDGQGLAGAPPFGYVAQRIGPEVDLVLTRRDSGDGVTAVCSADRRCHRYFGVAVRRHQLHRDAREPVDVVPAHPAGDRYGRVPQIHIDVGVVDPRSDGQGEGVDERSVLGPIPLREVARRVAGHQQLVRTRRNGADHIGPVRGSDDGRHWLGVLVVRRDDRHRSA